MALHPLSTAADLLSSVPEMIFPASVSLGSGCEAVKLSNQSFLGPM
jgi:hypothetical protein